jgi:Arginase family
VSESGERPPGPIRLNRYALEFAWQGVPTFMKLPVCLTPQDLRVGAIDVAVGGVPWDGTATTRSGMDVVEVSPPYDSGNNITALFAHRCVLEALTGTAMRRLGLTAPDYLDERSAGGPPPLVEDPD